MAETNYVWGPTFEEMLHPAKMDPSVRERALRAQREDPLDPVNLYNITWKNSEDRVNYILLPEGLTGVSANIIVMYGKEFPTGSHKVGASYSVIVEKQLAGEIVPRRDRLVFPSTGNYGIGGAWVGTRMGYESLVLLPELMSRERFEQIRYYGADYIKTPGCESNVKEIYDKCKELRQANPRNKILNQFEVFGNYLFHYYVTGNSALEVVEELARKGIGNGRVSAFVVATGSAGTIAAGDRTKQRFPECRIVGLEPIQCPTLFNNGYGGHDIQGIGDKHVPWIHNVLNMDAVMCIDDMECKLGLHLLTDPVGTEFLIEGAGIDRDTVDKMSQILGISGVCNVLGAIKTAKFYGMGPRDNIITVATDSIDRYRSVMAELEEQFGEMDKVRAALRFGSIFQAVKLDWIQEGTVNQRERWFNLKYYTWVEQQGKTVEELDAQRDPEYWLEKQALIPEIDRRLKAARGR